MLRPLLLANGAAIVTSWAAPLLHPSLLGVLAGDAASAVKWMAAIGFGVVVTWNLVHPDREAREEAEALKAEQREEFRRRAELVNWHGPVTTRTLPVSHGTRIRYLGPPLIITPPRGMEMMIHVELRAEPTMDPGTAEVIRGIWEEARRGSVQAQEQARALCHLALEQSAAIRERDRLDPDYGWCCEECGDAVPAGLRFCRPCATHGMPGYDSPWA